MFTSYTSIYCTARDIIVAFRTFYCALICLWCCNSQSTLHLWSSWCLSYSRYQIRYPVFTATPHSLGSAANANEHQSVKQHWTTLEPWTSSLHEPTFSRPCPSWCRTTTTPTSCLVWIFYLGKTRVSVRRSKGATRVNLEPTFL